jgi:hypothetical protein
MKLEDIPRRVEALIVAEAQQSIDRLIIAEHFDRQLLLSLRSRTSRGLCGLASFAEHL